MTSTIVKTSVSKETAQKLLSAAEKAATDLGLAMSIAVCDESGTLKAFVRMDGASLISVEIAQNKAYTAASLGMSTHGLFDFIKNDAPLLHGITHTPRLVIFGGGYPVKIDGNVVGGIGLSGGHYSQDMTVAEAALKTLT